MYTCTCGGQRLTYGVFLHLLRQSFLLNMEFIDSRDPGSLAQGSCLFLLRTEITVGPHTCPHPPTPAHNCPAFPMGAEDLYSNPHVSVASICPLSHLPSPDFIKIINNSTTKMPASCPFRSQTSLLIHSPDSLKSRLSASSLSSARLSPSPLPWALCRDPSLFFPHHTVRFSLGSRRETI